MKDLWDAQNLSIPQKVIYNGKRFFRFVIVFKLQKIVILRTVHKNYLGNPKWLFYDFGQKSECEYYNIRQKLLYPYAISSATSYILC